MRLDKYISDFTEMTRSQAKKALKAGEITVNGQVIKKGDDKVSFSDSILWKGVPVWGQQFQYIMLNKPAGVVSATTDNHDITVVEYIKTKVPVMDYEVVLAKDLFPMGRLDKDTEGLLVLTNDGELAHRLLSPKYHVEKTYFVKVDGELQAEDAEAMKAGMDIGEKQKTKPAKLQILSATECHITITEGKFHQVKRMFAKVGKPVVYLKRISMGTLMLDDKLEVGEWRFLTPEEIRSLRGEE